MAAEKHLIFLVDDDQAVREALRFALELDGLRVRIHDSGDGLLADPDLERADCIVFDDRNRGMDGIKLAGTLKQRNVAVPLIMLISHLTDQIRERARAAGINRVLEKPLMDNALRDNIRALIAERCEARHHP
ncbi:MAG TPA: response regulator [Rhodopila sp.]|uniref:response regulator n=1 Tax=Rhodopila sp. TaxID=2480087 RepID=UPI002CEAA4F7|nr:response regulator [Rhodopila sp.]HVY16699.1 response regulator [Rhodopila sp.]